MQRKNPPAASKTTDKVIITSPMSEMPTEDIEIIRKIKDIIARGNNAEVHRTKDGRLNVYEIKKKIV